MKTLVVLMLILTSQNVVNGKPMPDAVSSIERVLLEKSTGLVHIDGSLPTTCYRKPFVKLRHIDHESKTVHLDLVAYTRFGMVCPEGVGPKFSLAVDLNNFDLKAGETYRFVINDSSQFNGVSGELRFKKIDRSKEPLP